jgi:hypothetical protein
LTDDGRLFGLVEPERLEASARSTIAQIYSEKLDSAADEWIASHQP